MSDKPDFEQWAETVFDENMFGMYESNTEIISGIAKSLKQSWEAGYRYAVANDWWQTQEADDTWKQELAEDLRRTKKEANSLDHLKDLYIPSWEEQEAGLAEILGRKNKHTCEADEFENLDFCKICGERFR